MLQVESRTRSSSAKGRSKTESKSEGKVADVNKREDIKREGGGDPRDNSNADGPERSRDSGDSRFVNAEVDLIWPRLLRLSLCFLLQLSLHLLCVQSPTAIMAREEIISSAVCHIPPRVSLRACANSPRSHVCYIGKLRPAQADHNQSFRIPQWLPLRSRKGLPSFSRRI